MRRLLMWGAGLGLVISGLTFYIVHTGPVRRLALGRIQAFLSKARGLAVEVSEFDYNLLSSRFELKQVSLKAVSLSDMPAPVTAQRVVVSIPVWRLVLGSFETAQIRIDGLAIHWITATSGRSNWPWTGGSKQGAVSGGPAISVTSGELEVQDSRTGFLLHLPHGRLSMAWSASRRQYSVACTSSGGHLQWNEVRLALDQLQLKAALASSGFSVESLQFVSGESRAEVSGSVAGSPARIDARAAFDFDLQHLSGALGLAAPAQGRLLAAVFASGPVEALQVKARMSGKGIVVRGTPIHPAEAEAVLDTATGELQIRGVSARLFSGQLTGNARIWTGGGRRRSEFAARLAGLDPVQVSRAFGSGILPGGRPTVEVTGSWPGLNWRLGTISGVARSRAAALRFKAAGYRGSIRVLLDGLLGDAAGTHGDVALRFEDDVLTGRLSGTANSLARVAVDLERLLDRPAGSLSRPGIDGAADWSATLEGTLGKPSASVQLAVKGLSIGVWKDADVQVDAHCAVDRIEIRRARLVWGGQEVEVNGQIGGASADAPLRLEGTVEGRSLAPAFASLGFAQSAEAAVSGGFRINGTVSRPAVETTLSLVGLTAFGARFARATVDAGWRDTKLNVSRLRAEQIPESGAPGRFEASGSLDINDGGYSFNMVGQDLRTSASTLPSWPSPRRDFPSRGPRGRDAKSSDVRREGRGQRHPDWAIGRR